MALSYGGGNRAVWSELCGDEVQNFFLQYFPFCPEAPEGAVLSIN